jgi:hypothetical protein
MSWNSSVGIVTRLWARQMRKQLILSWVKSFSLLHIVHTGSRAHPAYNPMGTGSLFPPCELAEHQCSWLLSFIHLFISIDPYIRMWKTVIPRKKQYKRTYSQTAIHNITTFVSTKTILKHLIIKNYIWLTTYYKEMIWDVLN